MSSDGATGRGAAGSAEPLEAFREDAAALSLEAFEAKRGSGFLLLAAHLASPADTFSTELLLEDDPAERTGRVSTLVFALRGAASILTVGRAAANDVVIPDTSVSRQHALVKATEDGFLIRDANSSNGSEVNGVRVRAKGQGPALPLKTGDSVRLGRVDFTFVDAPALREYAAQLG